MKRYFFVTFLIINIILINIVVDKSFLNHDSIQHSTLTSDYHTHHHHHSYDDIEHQHAHCHSLIFADFYSNPTLEEGIVIALKDDYFLLKEQKPHFIPKEILRPPIS
jgi:regulatory protein YycI of two-component signal transduction system YycFG